MNICPSCPRNTRREQPDDVYLYCEGHTAKNVYPYHFHAQGIMRCYQCSPAKTEVGE